MRDVLEALAHSDVLQLDRMPGGQHVSHIQGAADASSIDAAEHGMAGVDETREVSAAAPPRVRIAWASWIQEFYAARGFRPAWINPHASLELRQAIDESHSDGLDPEDYHGQLLDRLAREVGSPAASDTLRAQYDVLQTESLLRLGYHLSFGKVDAESFDAQWNYGRTLPRRDAAERIEAALLANDVRARIEALKPSHRLYAALKLELQRYRAIAISGDPAPLPSGKTLRPGDVDPRVLQLRERLRLSGDLPAAGNGNVHENPRHAVASGEAAVISAGARAAGVRTASVTPEGAQLPSAQAVAPDPAVYDTQLEAAVRHFQSRMGLAVDGAVGERTREEINVPIAERILQLRVNLDRGRVLLQDLPPQFVVVNIASYLIYVVRGEEVVWSSRVQVGRTYRRTPIFRAQISYLVWNPAWTVPPGIIWNDILPQARQDPRSITRRGLTVLDRNGAAVDPASVDWSRFRSGHIPYTLRQNPGANNAMGRVKFMFPNNYDVYLHDTPSRSLFDASERTFSSGCVRVERPLELAQLLLNDPVNWNEAAIARTIDSGQTRNVTLRNDMPVLLAYWTAWSDGEGQVNFRRDIYGQDAQWAAGLDAPFSIRKRPLYSGAMSPSVYSTLPSSVTRTASTSSSRL